MLLNRYNENHYLNVRIEFFLCVCVDFFICVPVSMSIEVKHRFESFYKKIKTEIDSFCCGNFPMRLANVLNTLGG